MRRTTLILMAALALGACAKKTERVTFDGVYFPLKSKKASDDRQDFVVTVRKAEQNLELAREAGRYEGTRYCLQNFGTSEIDWSQGPDAEDGTVMLSGGSLTFRGRCSLW